MIAGSQNTINIMHPKAFIHIGKLSLFKSYNMLNISPTIKYKIIAIIYKYILINSLH